MHLLRMQRYVLGKRVRECLDAMQQRVVALGLSLAGQYRRRADRIGDMTSRAFVKRDQKFMLVLLFIQKRRRPVQYQLYKSERGRWLLLLLKCALLAGELE